MSKEVQMTKKPKFWGKCQTFKLRYLGKFIGSLFS